jgi:hypothetical protein
VALIHASYEAVGIVVSGVFNMCQKTYFGEIAARKSRDCADIPLGDTGCQYEIFSLFRWRKLGWCPGSNGLTAT